MPRFIVNLITESGKVQTFPGNFEIIAEPVDKFSWRSHINGVKFL
jgi:hypothetical protein